MVFSGNGNTKTACAPKYWWCELHAHAYTYSLMYPEQDAEKCSGKGIFDLKLDSYALWVSEKVDSARCLKAQMRL